MLKKIIITTTLLMPSLILANDGQNYQIELLNAIFQFIQVLALVIGVVFMIKFFILLVERSNPNSQIKTHNVIFWLLSAGILLSINQWIGVATDQIFGETTYCYALDPSQTDMVSGQCFDASNSTAVKGLQDRISNQVSQDAQFLGYVSIAFGLIQILGLIYFISSAMLIRKINTNGQDSVSPAKPIIGMFFSALLIDLPHTIELIRNTISLMGYTI